MATYYGTWVTNQYAPTFVNGEVWASINFATNSCSFVIKYNGSYQTGLVKRLETDIIENKGQVLTYMFQAKTFSSQSITFKASSISFDTITGDYTTTGPLDIGTFKMEKSYFDLNAVYNTLMNVRKSTGIECVIQ